MYEKEKKKELGDREGVWRLGSEVSRNLTRNIMAENSQASENAVFMPKKKTTK